MLTDLPLEELRGYRPDVAEPADFGAFWAGELAAARGHGPSPSFAAAATLPEVPFLAHPRRAVDVTDSSPYGELAAYCRVHPDRTEQVFATLAYADVVNHAKRATAPALFSVALADDIVPPSTVFAAFNHYAGPKEISVYPFSGHESGGTQQFLAQLAFLDRLGPG